MIKLGVVGIRGQAALWAQAASQSPGWRVRYCYHPVRSRHQAGLPFEQTDRLDDLIRTCDTVVIASPTYTHFHYLRALEKRGYPGPLLVEKPIVGSLKQCESLLRTFPKSFLLRVYVAHNWRFYPWVRRMYEILNSPAGRGAISADFQLTHDYGFKPGYLRSWRSQDKHHPVGPAETQGVHLIDLIHYLFGPLDWVGGNTVKRGSAGSAPDTASMFLMTKSQVSCSIRTSYVAPASQYARVVAPGFILTYRDGALLLQKRSHVNPKARSQPPAEQILLRTRPDALLSEPMRHQLKSLSHLLDHKGSNGLISAYQGIANAAVLGGFAQSLERQGPCFLSKMPIYLRTVRHFFPSKKKRRRLS